MGSEEHGMLQWIRESANGHEITVFAWTQLTSHDGQLSAAQYGIRVEV